MVEGQDEVSAIRFSPTSLPTGRQACPIPVGFHARVRHYERSLHVHPIHILTRGERWSQPTEGSGF